MGKTLTIAEIAEHYKRDRSTVLRWIEQNHFPNARLVESPVGNYWEIPASDTKNFNPPARGRKKLQKQGESVN